MVKIKKSSSGRQKIPIEKIPKKSHLQVTFSKRRSGLFKKASELCTLCGVEIVIIVFSPAGKAFSFGHHDVESIIDRYLLSRDVPRESGASKFVEAHRNANIRELNMQLTQILNQLEIEKKHGQELDELRKARQKQFWWESPVDELGLQELQQLKFSLEELKKNIARQANKMMLMENTAALPPPPMVGGAAAAANNGFAQFYDGYEQKPVINHAGLASSVLPNGYNFTYRHGNKGILFTAIDQNKPLSEQGPFVIVLHKLSGKEWRDAIEDYKQKHPEVTILDPPDAIQHLQNHQSMLQDVADLNLYDCHGKVCVPRQLVITNDPSSIPYKVSKDGMKLPLVAKPLVVDGSAKSHELYLAYDEFSLSQLEPPLVLQEFVKKERKKCI